MEELRKACGLPPALGLPDNPEWWRAPVKYSGSLSYYDVEDGPLRRKRILTPMVGVKRAVVKTRRR